MIKHPKRPRDPNQLGKLIVDLSVGEVSEAEPIPDSLRQLTLAARPGQNRIMKRGERFLHFRHAQTLDQAEPLLMNPFFLDRL